MNLDWRIKRNIVAAGILVTILLMFCLNKVLLYADSNELENTKAQKQDNIVNEYETYRDFSLNNILHSKTGVSIPMQ